MSSVVLERPKANESFYFVASRLETADFLEEAADRSRTISALLVLYAHKYSNFYIFNNVFDPSIHGRGKILILKPEN